jgi:ribosomal protein L12E/L44/L45/RPP1/RPP2
MLNQNMPNIPGMGAMTDTLEFVKNLWGGLGVPGMNMPSMNMTGMNIPGMVMPTLSVEEIRKKITDLKTVESWLELNMNMLKSTIQALEVQAATISTLQSMGDALNATMQASANVASAAREAASPPDASSPEPAAAAAEPKAEEKNEPDSANMGVPLANAAAWWNLLQDQFRQAVTTAMAQPDSSVPSGGAVQADAGEPSAETETPPPSGRKKKPAK